MGGGAAGAAAGATIIITRILSESDESSKSDSYTSHSVDRHHIDKPESSDIKKQIDEFGIYYQKYLEQKTIKEPSPWREKGPTKKLYSVATANVNPVIMIQPLNYHPSRNNASRIYVPIFI